MDDTVYEAARLFLHRQGRLVERRLFATLFEGAPATGVVDALRGYQNGDGGFGHALEPDKRDPSSLPIDVEVAFQTLAAADARDESMVRRACDYLASVAEPGGAVPLAFPTMEAYPRAEHWSDWTYRPGVFPTAGLVGLLFRLGVDHPWRALAAEFCWSSLEGAVPDDAHALAEVLVLLEHAPHDGRSTAVLAGVRRQLPTAAWYRGDPWDPGYGVTPLHLAPTPDSPWRRLFDDDLLDGHLERLRRDQQPDGGWPLTWEPPGEAAVLEWRGIETLRALRTLAAYEGWAAGGVARPV